MKVYAIVENTDSGYESQAGQFKSLGFEVGQRYEVEHIDMGQSSTSIYLKDYPDNCFNSVFFTFEEGGKDLDIFSDARFNPYISMFRKGD